MYAYIAGKEDIKYIFKHIFMTCAALDEHLIMLFPLFDMTMLE